MAPRLLPSLLLTRTTAVWLLLIVATLVSWQLGADHGLGSDDDHTASSIFVIVIAIAKVRLVGLYFMELRCAPTVLRALFEAYCAVVGALVVGMYLAA
jgi:hypothetical protein